MRYPSLLALMLCLPATAHASAIVISPVDPVIRTGEQATALWLENKGKEAVTMQVRTFGWSQISGEEHLDTQDAVIASPPIATVAPGSRQLVRIIRRTPSAAPESAYRLLVDELPTPPSDAEASPQARLTVQMRYSIPLFALTGTGSAARLDAQITAKGDGRVLSIRNTGQVHARLTDLRLVSGGRDVVVRAGLAGYVLPGSTLAIPLDPGATGTVKVGVNGTDQILAAAI